jgi:hypothetical protein
LAIFQRFDEISGAGIVCFIGGFISGVIGADATVRQSETRDLQAVNGVVDERSRVAAASESIEDSPAQETHRSIPHRAANALRRPAWALNGSPTGKQAKTRRDRAKRQKGGDACRKAASASSASRLATISGGGAKTSGIVAERRSSSRMG